MTLYFVLGQCFESFTTNVSKVPMILGTFKEDECDHQILPERKQNLHPWARVKVDQAVRPLPPKKLSILVGLV